MYVSDDSLLNLEDIACMYMAFGNNYSLLKKATRNGILIMRKQALHLGRALLTKYIYNREMCK